MNGIYLIHSVQVLTNGLYWFEPFRLKHTLTCYWLCVPPSAVHRWREQALKCKVYVFSWKISPVRIRFIYYHEERSTISSVSDLCTSIKDINMFKSFNCQDWVGRYFMFLRFKLNFGSLCRLNHNSDGSEPVYTSVIAGGGGSGVWL